MNPAVWCRCWHSSLCDCVRAVHGLYLTAGSWSQCDKARDAVAQSEKRTFSGHACAGPPAIETAFSTSLLGVIVQKLSVFWTRPGRLVRQECCHDSFKFRAASEPARQRMAWNQWLDNRGMRINSTMLPSGSLSCALRLLFPVSCGLLTIVNSFAFQPHALCVYIGGP